MDKTWNRTRYSLYLGALDEAVICNLCAILFIVFRTNYGLTFEQLGRLILVNFCVQMAADLVNGALINKVDPRKIILIGSSATFLGYLCYAILPGIMSPYSGLMIATVIISWGCGTYEMMLSPLINAIPSDTKVQDMALLHSFYAWGVAFAVVFATLFFFGAGLFSSVASHSVLAAKTVFYTGLFKFWYILPLLYSIIPLILIINFSSMKMPRWVSEEKRTKLKDFVTKPYFILVAIAIGVGGGVECILSNWISIFAEKGLGYNKFIGDMIGLFGYAITMGISRHLMGTRGEKWDLSKVLIFASLGAVLIYLFASLCPINIISLILCICGGAATGMLWPGALNLAGLKFPFAGALMFAILAFAGDTGVAIIPWLNGVFSDYSVHLSKLFSYMPGLTDDA
ncbi:MAG: MFS transporter, partial [Armatimonadetes bacterium]|nr:MFS transporter [Candidatus Hippobium faecium]